ncbi:MAG: hypothetical protein KIT14_24200 [bacterium]|nr:hypothetical protein [bacterium]
MPVFAYRAFTDAGRATQGVIDADSRQGAWEALRARGVFPTVLDESRAAGGGRVAAAEVAGLLRQLAVPCAAACRARRGAGGRRRGHPRAHARRGPDPGPRPRA